MRRRIGIFGGSFNPVHAGHLMLASWIAQSGLVDSVWLVLSPQNPLKDGTDMASDAHRMSMLKIALEHTRLIEISDIELRLPRPSYTITTLQALSEEFPESDFVPIVGSDNLAVFKKWRDWETILADYGLIVYPRPGFPLPDVLPEGVTSVDAPVTDISSTRIRQCIRRSWDMNFFLPHGVYSYIKKNRLYT